MSYEKKKSARWRPVSFLLTALFFCILKERPLKNLDVLSAQNTSKPCSEKLQGFFFPHNTQHRMLSAELEANIHCWSQILPSDACIHKCTNETAQLSAQFVVINLHIYQERSDIRLPFLSPRLGGGWQLAARQPLMLTVNQTEAAGCLVLLWQRDNSEIFPAWKQQYSGEIGETGNLQQNHEINCFHVNLCRGGNKFLDTLFVCVKLLLYCATPRISL